MLPVCVTFPITFEIYKCLGKQVIQFIQWSRSRNPMFSVNKSNGLGPEIQCSLSKNPILIFLTHVNRHPDHHQREGLCEASPKYVKKEYMANQVVSIWIVRQSGVSVLNKCVDTDCVLTCGEFLYVAPNSSQLINMFIFVKLIMLGCKIWRSLKYGPALPLGNILKALTVQEKVKFIDILLGGFLRT